MVADSSFEPVDPLPPHSPHRGTPSPARSAEDGRVNESGKVGEGGNVGEDGPRIVTVDVTVGIVDGEDNVAQDDVEEGNAEESNVDEGGNSGEGVRTDVKAWSALGEQRGSCSAPPP